MVRLLAVLAAGLSWAGAAQAGDPAHGRAVFAAQCSACHSNTRDEAVVLGPPLYGVVGRKAGSVAGFSYSPAMKSAGFQWDPEKLHAYLPAPRSFLPGVRMTYQGLKNPAQLDDLIAYLQTLK
ncbi:MAG: cytochrome c class [Phenylobacterium sp.]|nr:cytochrome c class [Phenylobacterium sp.]